MENSIFATQKQTKQNKTKKSKKIIFLEHFKVNSSFKSILLNCSENLKNL